MSKEIYISSTPHETRLAIVEDEGLAEIYYERENEYTLAGSIYNGRVTRVLPGMQSAFVEIGLERDAFLYITDFLEETEDEDAADLDASAGNAGAERGGAERGGSERGGSERGERDRGGRGDGRGRDRGGRDRGDRDRGARPEGQRTAEPSDAELFQAAVAGLEAPRTIDGQRSSGRGGDRNGDRGRRPESAPVPEIAAAGAIGIPEGGDEIGEGQPGAEGSRRWRGRRGRRGRGGRAGVQGTPQEQAADAANDLTLELPEQGLLDPEFVEADEPLSFEAVAETLPTEAEQREFRQRAAEPQQPREPQVQRGVQPADSSRREERGGRERGGRESRGGRDRGGDRVGREEGTRDASVRGDRGPQRAPRGFAPAAERYGAPAYGEEVQSEAPVEPIILPGESLSKYRVGGNEPSAEVKATPAPVVDTFVAEGWDGGFVLPGETLRPRNNPTALRNDSAPAGRNDSPRGGRDRGGRDRDRGGRGGDRGRSGGDRPARIEASSETEILPVAIAEPVPMPTPLAPEHVFADPVEQEGNVPAAEAAQVETETYLSDPERVPASHLVTPLNTTFVPPPPLPVESAPVVEAEYEPTEASASYRIDPVPPSEFRVSAPAVEEAETIEPAPVEQATATKFDVGSDFSGYKPFHAEESETASGMQDVTTIDSTGEMHSDLPLIVGANEHELAGQEASEPTGLHAEEILVGRTEFVEPLHEEPITADMEPVSDAPHHLFEPGMGLLEEEEMLEDDDDTLPTLRASHASFESDESELVEGGAELGMMLRERSLEQRMQPGTALDEDEEPDEDYVEEDQDFIAGEFDEEDEEDDEELGRETGEERGLDEPVGEFVDRETTHAEPVANGESLRPATGEPMRREGGRRRGRRGGSDRERGGSDRSSSERSPAERSPAERSPAERPAAERSASERSASDRTGYERSQRMNADASVRSGLIGYAASNGEIAADIASSGRHVDAVDQPAGDLGPAEARTGDPRTDCEGADRQEGCADYLPHRACRDVSWCLCRRSRIPASRARSNPTASAAD